NAPYPGGHVHHDCILPESLAQTWLVWQDMFSPFSWSQSSKMPAHQVAIAPTLVVLPDSPSKAGATYSGHLMQQLGIDLWKWLFDGPIQSCLERSQGIAIGIGPTQTLRLRLEVRDPDLILMPWEIMQPQIGKQAISLSQQLLFSRTTSDVAPLPPLRTDQNLNILLVLGEESSAENSSSGSLKLEEEAKLLASILENSVLNNPNAVGTFVPCQVDTLIMPTAAELISTLENGIYNVLFYSGHGAAAPNGGLLFLRPGVTMNGVELAQVLTRCRVTLAVFNSCWGAQSARINHQAIGRSSLAEVLIHHGVPAVLAMRDAIADQEAMSFIEAFARALAERKPIDQAVAIARQQLLTLYKFNQPAWTLPVLYIHPEFDGQLLEVIPDITELPPDSPTSVGRPQLNAYLRPVGFSANIYHINSGLLRIGRAQKNDLVIVEKWVSQTHAEILCRCTSLNANGAEANYFLRDFSRFGTLISGSDGVQKVHHEQVSLKSGMELKFGSSKGQTWEFVIGS
ncbi:MAG: CHAT domain-containing protein, partial [Phormidium sp.]